MNRPFSAADHHYGDILRRPAPPFQMKTTQEKFCKRCGVKLDLKSPAQKWCPPCKKERGIR